MFEVKAFFINAWQETMLTYRSFRPSDIFLQQTFLR